MGEKVVRSWPGRPLQRDARIGHIPLFEDLSPTGGWVARHVIGVTMISDPGIPLPEARRRR